MSQNGYRNMNVLEKMKSLILRQVFFTAVAAADGETLCNAIEDLESELNCLENIDLGSTATDYQTELYTSCQEEICIIDHGSTTPGHQTDLYSSCQEEPNQSYKRDIYCRDLFPKSLNTSCDEDTYDILDNHDNTINQANISLIAMKGEIGRYQDSIMQVRNSLVPLDEGLENDNSVLNKKDLRNSQSYSVNQVHVLHKAMMQEIPGYTNLIFGIRDGIVQMDVQLLEANKMARFQREYHNNNKPSPVKDYGNQKTSTRKVYKSLEALVKEIQRYQDILFGIRDGIVIIDDNLVQAASPVSKEIRSSYGGNCDSTRSSSSEISIDSCDGGSFSTWDLDEWLVVDIA